IRDFHVTGVQTCALPIYRGAGGESSPMTALDEQFVAIAEANPGLRVRVGNPDELRSNKLDRTLDAMKHRVHEPEPGVAESPTGRSEERRVGKEGRARPAP